MPRSTEELNVAMRRNGLRLATDPEYTSLDISIEWAPQNVLTLTTTQAYVLYYALGAWLDEAGQSSMLRETGALEG